MKKIITISRECGSSGHIIGQKLAKEFGIPIYDKEIISMVAKEKGYTEDSEVKSYVQTREELNGSVPGDAER